MESTDTTDKVPALNAATAVARQLDKASRVFRMYDRSNDLVGRFLQDLYRRIRVYIDDYGSLTLDIRPNSMEYEGEKLEASGLDEMALTLFRQGLYSLKIDDSLDEEALLELLVILTTGGRSWDLFDDDLVTLLWKADIEGVDYTAVLGYEESGDDDDVASVDEIVEALDNESDQAEGAGLGDEAGYIPYHELLESGVAVQPPPAVLELMAPVHTETLADLQNATVEIVGEAMLSPYAYDHLDDAQAFHILDAMLGSFIEAGNFDTLARYTGFLQYMRDPRSNPNFPFGAAVARVFQHSLSSERLDALLAGLEEDIRPALQPLSQLLHLLGAHLIEHLVSLLRSESRELRRTGLRALLLELVKDKPDIIVELLDSASREEIPELFHMLYLIDSSRAQELLAEAFAIAEDEDELTLNLLIDHPGCYDDVIQGVLMLRVQQGGQVAAAAIGAICKLDDRSIVEVLWERARAKNFANASLREASSILRALVELSPKSSTLLHMSGIIEQRSLLRRKGLEPMKIAAARALGASDARRAYLLLKDAVEKTQSPVREACKEAIQEILSRRHAGGEQAKPGDGGEG